MKTTKFLKAMIALGVLAACVCSMAACSNSNSTASNAAAATVNGVEISEQEITDTIQNLRAQASLEEEDAWGQYLASTGSTPQTIREQYINSEVDRELLKEGASELGVKVEQSEIDSYVESMRNNFDSDEAWQEALSQAGFTEESYRQSIEESLTTQKVSEHFQDEAKTEESDILETAKTYGPYYDGAKRSSHILFKVEDTSDEKAMKEAREKAQEVLDRINNGEISFEDAAKEYSEDSSAENGGDVGWDSLSSFVEEYTTALADLDKDQVSGLVESQYGIHIIKVTDVFTAPKEIKSIKDFPEAFRENIENMAKSTKASSDYQAWLDGLKEKADIVINDMPENVPYNVDMSKYETASGESAEAEGEGADESASGESAEGEASDEAASDEAASDEAAASEEAASDEAASSEAAASDEAANDESASAESAEAEGEGEGENAE